MKIRGSIILFTAIVVALIALVLWLGKKKPAEMPLPTAVQSNAVQQATLTKPSSVSANVPVHTNAPTASSATNMVQTPMQGKWEQMQQILATQNDIPIVFYGRVIDQFDDGVANAAVNFSIGVYNGHESTEKRGQVMTDGNGFFKIEGYKGYNLGIMPEKAGYVLATRDTLFKYSHLETDPYVSSSSNPTVVKMYKLQGAERLVNFNIKTYIPIDGAPIRFDLKDNKQVQSGGDLIINIQSSPEPNFQTGYDWKASIRMADGGIIQNTDGLGLDKMFQAPNSGYQPEFDLSFQKGTQQWTSRFIDCFYFTTQNNQAYGKMAISIITDRVENDAIPVSLTGYLNPSGSRNLEIDPAKVTEAKP